MDTNVKSVVALSELAVPYLEKTKGVIISMSSMGSIRPFSAVSICDFLNLFC